MLVSRIIRVVLVGSCGFRSVSLIVDLSRIPIGIFFREVHPDSEVASQNDQNKAK